MSYLEQRYHQNINLSKLYPHLPLIPQKSPPPLHRPPNPTNQPHTNHHRARNYPTQQGIIIQMSIGALYDN